MRQWLLRLEPPAVSASYRLRVVSRRPLNEGGSQSRHRLRCRRQEVRALPVRPSETTGRTAVREHRLQSKAKLWISGSSTVSARQNRPPSLER